MNTESVTPEVIADPRPIIVRADIDKVSEDEMARLVGTTPKALERKRQRKVIPPGVYALIDGRIMYSIRRYDQWVESQWPDYQPALKSSAAASASVSPGESSVSAKRLPTRPRRKVSKPQQVYVLQ